MKRKSDRKVRQQQQEEREREKRKKIVLRKLVVTNFTLSGSAAHIFPRILASSPILASGLASLTSARFS